MKVMPSGMVGWRRWWGDASAAAFLQLQEISSGVKGRCGGVPGGRRVEFDKMGPLIERNIVVPSPHEGLHECCAAWFIQGGRFILHPARSNRAVVPPSFVLPSPAQVVRRLTRSMWMRKYDLRGWFLQIEMPPCLRTYFQFEAIDKLGRVSRWALARTPMGFSGSPVAADNITRRLAGVASEEDWEGDGDVLVYQDDVLALTEAAARRFETRCREWGVEIKSIEGGGRLTYVGLELATPEGWFRPTEKLTAKLMGGLAEGRARGLSRTACQRVAGFAISFLERAGEVLTRADPLIRLAARGEALPAGEVGRRPALGACFGDLERLAVGRGWRRAVRPGRVAHGASDASMEGYGFVWRCEGVTAFAKGSFSSGCGLHISLLELLAVKKAIAAAPAGAELRLWVDNMCVLEWLKRGLPRVRLAAQVILEIDGMLRRQGQILRVAYVESARNPADGLSRGEEEPGDFEGLAWAPEPARRVLGWATRCGEETEESGWAWKGEEEGEATEAPESWEETAAFGEAAESLGYQGGCAPRGMGSGHI